MSFLRYSEYRDSGVEWLGEVPGHWGVMPLKRIVYMQSGEAITSGQINETGDFPVFGGNGVRGFTDRHTHEGEFALVGRQGALCGNVNYAFSKFWASEHAVVCHPRQALSTRWLGELLRTMNLGQYSVAAAQPGLSVELISRIEVPLPPLPEQHAIAAFLDRETARIDALIAEQEKLIALLKEKRQAVISHAVTKGLDPNVPMKDSGVEWLGMVPGHWRVVPLKHVLHLKSGGTPSKAVPEYWDGDVPWASSKDLKSEVMYDSIDHISRLAVDSGAAELVPVGSILLVVRGMILAHTFPVTVTATPMAINQDLKAATAGNDLDATFLAWLLRGSAPETLGRTDEAGHGTKVLRMEAWTSMRLPIPPLREQACIAEFIAVNTTRLDTLTTEATNAITLLQERRTALISAAVTGKIDVRSIPV